MHLIALGPRSLLSNLSALAGHERSKHPLMGKLCQLKAKGLVFLYMNLCGIMAMCDMALQMCMHGPWPPRGTLDLSGFLASPCGNWMLGAMHMGGWTQC